jgi:hypothetical protein
MAVGRYSRGLLIDPLRRLLRVFDFLFLLRALRHNGCLPRRSRLDNTTFIELGPGPTRLAFLKRRIFGQVLFVDQSDFGIPDPGLRIADLEQVKNAPQLIANACGLAPAKQVMLFADHCLEHISAENLLPLLQSIIEAGYLACFRVPNIASPAGLRSFHNDVTHQTSFDSCLRRQLAVVGFSITPWMRWYRPQLIFRTLLLRKPLMEYAEEIAICSRLASIRRQDSSAERGVLFEPKEV